MSFRHFFSAAVVCATVLSSVNAMAVGETELENEIQKMSNVINNSVPGKYRDQLNIGLARIESAAARECGGGGPQRPQPPRRENPTCEIKRDSATGYYMVTRQGEKISGYYNDILSTVSEFNKYADAGLCERNTTARECAVTKDNSTGYFMVTRQGEKISGYYNDILSAASEHAKYVRANLCYQDSLRMECSVLKDNATGYFFVSRDSVKISGYYNDILAAASEMKKFVNSELCY